MIRFLLTLFAFNTNPPRAHLKYVLPDDLVRLEWDRAKPKLCNLRCVNNDTKTKKILLQVIWENYKEHNLPEKELVIFGYGDYELRDFNLLNPQFNKNRFKDINKIETTVKDLINTTVDTLTEKMNKALEQEDYETAQILKNQIEKIKKK